MKETTMQYKTIILELLHERPRMQEQLRQSRQLLPVLERYARGLKTSHEAWKETLMGQRPGSDPTQITSEALEMAVEELTGSLDSESPPKEGEALSLDEAMQYLCRPTSRG
jgi:hypothetical protein